MIFILADGTHSSTFSDMYHPLDPTHQPTRLNELELKEYLEFVKFNSSPEYMTINYILDSTARRKI